MRILVIGPPGTRLPVVHVDDLADLYTRDQDVSSALTRTALGWHPRHRTLLTELTPVTPVTP